MQGRYRLGCWCPGTWVPATQRGLHTHSQTQTPASLFQALFRPITVVVPDRQLIIENALMAEGFVTATALAKKASLGGGRPGAGQPWEEHNGGGASSSALAPAVLCLLAIDITATPLLVHPPSCVAVCRALLPAGGPVEPTEALRLGRWLSQWQRCALPLPACNLPSDQQPTQQAVRWLVEAAGAQPTVRCNQVLGTRLLPPLQGLRAIKSVLVVAGGLLRSQEGQDEQDVLFRALR